MKRTIAAALLVAAFAAQAEQPAAMKSSTGGCNLVGDQVVCVDPPQCFAPARWVCTERGTLSCQCVVKPEDLPGRLCTASIVYVEHAPAGARLSPMEPHCDAVGAELAVAAALARMLGAP